MNDKFCYYNCETANQLQEVVANHIVYKKSRNFPVLQYWNKYTGSIPLTEHCTDSFKKFYLTKIVDENTLDDLENENVINTNPTLAKLYPIITPADGNCLCHAVSLYVWGIPDTRNFLRKLLHVTLRTDENKLLQRLHMQHVANQQVSEENFHTGIWNTQWDKLVKDTNDVPSNPGSTMLESLEAIHIFILANILLRPIIVLSSPVVKTIFNQSIQSDNIGGIYLPLLCNPDDTEKSPIVLGFHMNHFTPLLYMESNKVKEIPLKRVDFVTLPVHFFQDLMPNSIAKKLKMYLNIDKKTESVLITEVPLPQARNVFYAHLDHCNVLYGSTTLSVAEEKPNLKGISQTNGDEWNNYFERHSETLHIISSAINKSPSLCINNCGMYGSAELGNKCSKCFTLNPTLSDMNHRRRAEPAKELKPTYEDVSEQNTNKQYLESKMVLLSPAAENRFSAQAYAPVFFQSSQKTSQDQSEQNHKKESSKISLHSHFRPTEFLSSEETAILMPTPHKLDDQFEETNLEIATCITSGCRGKAHRKLQYRCPSCFIDRQKHKPVHNVSELGGVGNPSQHSEKLPEIVPEQATGNMLSELSPINRINYSTPQTLSSMEDRQVSLLDLLCSKENCPNRRISQFDPLCLSCSKKSDKLYCSTPGCSNEQEQNVYAMCNVCFQNNKLQRQKIPSKINTIGQIFGIDSYKPNHGRRRCDKPNCINSSSVHSTGYCIQCFAFMEKQEFPQPTAPTFHN